MARVLGYGGIANTNGTRSFAGKSESAGPTRTGSWSRYTSVRHTTRHLVLILAGFGVLAALVVLP